MLATRRNIIEGLLALPIISLAASCGPTIGTTGKDPLSKAELSFLSALADTIIPDTDTPGALAGNVPGTLGELLNNWASTETRARWRKTLADLKANLDGQAAGSFEKADAAGRTKRLGALDTDVFAKADHPLKAYRDVKSTIATAYYMSEPGATQELRYSAVPGNFRGSAPVGRTWAT
jgi:gluconate 2-dehydrogenase gamma chain